MAFQDFDAVSERRKSAASARLKKKILVGTVSFVLLACIVGAAAFVIVNRSAGNDKAAAKATAQRVDQYSRLVKMICKDATYQNKCETTLTEALKKDPKMTQPKDFLMVSMVLAENEVDKAFNETSNLKFANEEEKGAYDDCKLLYESTKEDMEKSINKVGSNTVASLAKMTPELNNWLSAVLSNQQTCLDGIPDGEFKDNMEKMFKESKELLSNSLAVITEVAKIVSAFQGGISGFRLPWLKSGAPAPAPAGSVASTDAVVDRAAPIGAPGAAPVSGPAAAPVAADLAAPNATPASAPAPAWAAPVIEVHGSLEKPTPNVTVAKDGSGNFKTISEALAAIPKTYEGRYVVYVKEGIYDELVTVEKNMVNLTMYGDGGSKTMITGNRNFVDGTRTFQTASFVVLGNGFLGRDIGARNTAGAEKHQAVAIRVQADLAIFMNCNFEGYQDTLYAQTHTQFYRDCTISGTIDFIFGDASAVFQNCTLIIRKPLDNQQNIVTAQGRLDKSEETGFVLQNCVFKGEDGLPPTTKNYLGRPWKEFSRTIIMESEIPSLIHPDGWLPWEGEFALKTLYYGEYNNRGAGASTANRVKWATRHDISREEAITYTVDPFLQGTVKFINGTGVPATLGLYY